MMLNAKLILFVLFISLASFNLSFDLDKFEGIKKKWKDVLKGRRQNLLVDIDDLEYPRANETLRKLHEERWSEYYGCLRKSQLTWKSPHPTTVMTTEGSSVQLDCKICISPEELHAVELIEWYYNSTTNETLTNIAVDVTEHTIISPGDRSLRMFSIGTDGEGFYWCQLRHTISPPYYVHISGETDMRVVRGEEAPDAPHPEGDVIIDEYGLRVFTSWGAWSSCSKCGGVGRRQRYGHCAVSLANSGGSDFLRSQRNEEADDAKDADGAALIERILMFFGNKIPCRSRYTPRKIRDLPQVKNRQNEIMRRFCKVKCQDSVVFEIRDKSGNVIESANNSAGIYSMIQGMPEPQPSVQRVTLYKKHDGKAELKCPGNLNSDTPITWQIGTRALNPLTISEESNGRISIDSRERVIFKKLRFADSSVYSCWQRGKLAGTIRLEVTYEVELKFDHRVMMLGAIAIISVFLHVFWRAFRGRKRYTIH